MRRFGAVVVTGLLLFAMPACAATPGGSGGSSDTITRQQMLEVNASDVYEAVQKLRPSWLTSRGPTSLTDSSPSVVSVFLNGNHVGDSEFLHNLRPDDIDRLRYYEAGEASARFGMGHPRGVIEVYPR